MTSGNKMKPIPLQATGYLGGFCAGSLLRRRLFQLRLHPCSKLRGFRQKQIKSAYFPMILFFTLVAYGAVPAATAYGNGEFHQKAVEEAGGNEDAAVKLPPGISATGQTLPQETQPASVAPTPAQPPSQNNVSSQQNPGGSKTSMGTAVTLFIVFVCVCVVVFSLQYIYTKSMIRKK